MRPHAPVAFAAALTLSACTSTRAVEPGTPGAARLDALAERQPATLVLRDGQRVRARGLVVGPGTTRWVGQDGAGQAVPTSDVREVRFRRVGRGALQGLGIGPLVGAAGGAALGAVTYEETEPGDWCIIVCSPRDAAVLSGMFFGLIGVVAGPLVGAAVGARERYVLRPSAGPSATSDR